MPATQSNCSNTLVKSHPTPLPLPSMVFLITQSTARRNRNVDIGTHSPASLQMIFRTSLSVCLHPSLRINSSPTPCFPNVTHFLKCDPFFQLWPIFPSMSHFYMFDSFFEVWPIFPSVTHFSKFQLLLQVWPIFANVTYFSMCDPFWIFNPFFLVWCLFFQVWPTFFQMWPIFPSVTHCS